MNLDEDTILRIVQEVTAAVSASGTGISAETVGSGSSDPAPGVATRSERRAASGVAGARRGSAGDEPGLGGRIDHTLLRPDATRAEITELCSEARTYGFVSVCVNPCHVRWCADLLLDSSVRVCTVVGFPLGATSTESKAFEARTAIADGASEIDMVINLGALKSHDYRAAARDIEAVAEVCRTGGAILKVIIEAALLSDEEKVAACQIATLAGADYVKTSTGFGPGGATVEDVILMRRVVPAHVGVKAAGGIRTRADAERMIEAGATRIGTSAGVMIVLENER